MSLLNQFNRGEKASVTSPRNIVLYVHHTPHPAQPGVLQKSPAYFPDRAATPAWRPTCASPHVHVLESCILDAVSRTYVGSYYRMVPHPESIYSVKGCVRFPLAD